MRYLLLAVLGMAFAGSPHAEAASCKAAAAEKKLAGAALSSFIKKCQSDARSACDLAAGDKRLAGAARTSFTTKCVRDKVGG
jgi:hypothetical protein